MNAWIGLIVALLLAASVGQAQTPIPASSGSVAPFTPEQVNGIKEFYKNCLKREKVGSVRPMGTADKGIGMPLGLLSAEIIAAPDQRKESIDFDAGNGRVFSYFRGDLSDDPSVAGRTHKDAIPESTAWERALPVLNYYKASTVRDEYKFQLVDLSTREQKGDLYGAFWDISKNLTYEGVPCKLCRMSVSISASSGEIMSIIYAPIAIPRDAQLLISKGEAVDKAKAWLTDRPRFKGKAITFDEASPDCLTKVIARPLDIMLAKGESLSCPDTGEAYYCWEVPFAVAGNESKFTVRIWVRIDTGDVIGGY